MQTQPHEIAAWLGDDWPEEQIQLITDEYQRLERTLNLDEEESEALLTAIARQVDVGGTLDWYELMEAHLRAQLHADEALRTLRAAVRADVSQWISASI